VTRFAAFFFVLAVVGCTERTSTVPLPRGDAIDAEESWNEQIAAVRAGLSDEIRISDELITAEHFDELKRGCDSLATLLIDQAELADTDLAVLSALPRLRWLKLPTPVGDEGAFAIARCTTLERLNLPLARFSDAGLSAVASLEGLTLLRFGSPNVTDEGLQELRYLPRLKFLHLLGVPITDAGLPHIASIETLQSFYLDGGRTTDAGLRKLLADRPDLHFHKDQRHLPGDPQAHRHE
jgi:hypothetical protein